MSFGSLAGFCSGYALKGIGRAGAFTVGCLFMGLTGLQRAGYIEVNWNKVAEANPNPNPNPEPNPNPNPNPNPDPNPNPNQAALSTSLSTAAAAGDKVRV